MTRKKFDFSNLVIIGAWNVSIINPPWLYDQFPNILKNKGECTTFIKMVPSTVYQYNFDQAIVELSSSRITLIPKSDNQKSLSFISRLGLSIYDRLPHTPVIAVGHNFIYKVGKKDALSIIKILEDRKAEFFLNSINSDNIIEKEAKYSFAFTDHHLSISFIDKNDIISVSLNYHYPIESRLNIEKAIQDLIVNYKDSKIIYNSLVGVETS